MAEIRKGEVTDLARIEDCAKAANGHYVERIGREPAPLVANFAASIDQRHLYVIEVDDDVAGFVVFYARDDHMHLENIATRPAYQQCGYEVFALDMSMFTLGGGGVHCLCQALKRDPVEV